jgi:hypothetical protein
LDGLKGRSASGPNVFDHQDLGIRFDGKVAPKGENSLCVSLCKNGTNVTAVGAAGNSLGYLLTDYDSSDGGRCDDIHRKIAKSVGKSPTQTLGVQREL